jgi:hypothetical protein
MYCSKCGAAFPSTSNFCPQCGAPALKEDPVHGWRAEETSVGVSNREGTAGAEALDNVPTVNEVSGPISAIDPESAEAQEAGPQDIAIASRDSNSEAQPNSSNKVVGDSSQQKYANSGSIVLAVFSALCLILGVMQGFIPIFLIAAIIFGGLATLCAFRWPLPMLVHAVVLTSSLVLAGVVGIALDRDTFGPSYRYLTQGNSEIRIDEKSGRTDRLANGGWVPIAFDHNAMQLPEGEDSKITLSNGVWKSSYPGAEVCFDASNFSSYVVKTIAIAVTVKDKAGNEVKELSDNPFDLSYSASGPAGTTLTSSYGLVNTGESYQVCKYKPRTLADGETWSYTGTQAWGWKK